MNIYAIGDLHLSHNVNKPMNIFGPAWERHEERIACEWRALVRDDDIVLIPGDFSWAMRLEEAKLDIDYLHNLPGTKILIRGNHDYWWSSLTKVREALPPNVYAIQNDYISINGVNIGGTRGWTCPGGTGYTAQDEKLYKREVQRLELSLKTMPKGGTRIAMIHYPPFNENLENSGFTELMEKYEIETVVYGHLHGKSCSFSFKGVRNSVNYVLVSADYIDFRPKHISSVCLD